MGKTTLLLAPIACQMMLDLCTVCHVSIHDQSNHLDLRAPVLAAGFAQALQKGMAFTGRAPTATTSTALG